jgi:hypothetical protein
MKMQSGRKSSQQRELPRFFTFLLALTAVLPLVLSTAETLNTDQFQLALSNNWVKDKSSNPERINLHSSQPAVTVTLQFTAITVAPEQLEEVARMAGDLRLDDERSAAKQHNASLTVLGPNVIPCQQGFRASYSGQDGMGRTFRFLALAMPGKLVAFYAESSTQTPAELEAVTESLLKGLIL